MTHKEIKKWFEANYLDGDEVQDGQMLSSETCLEALTTLRNTLLQEEIRVLDGMKKDVTNNEPCNKDDAIEMGLKHGFNTALQTIIDRYKEELNQK